MVDGGMKDNGTHKVDDEMIAELGGREGFIRILERFYERLFEDSLMKVLFNESKEEKSAYAHGSVLGSFILMLTTGDETYFSMKEAHGKSVPPKLNSPCSYDCIRPEQGSCKSKHGHYLLW